jgi:hypothetical protein
MNCVYKSNILVKLGGSKHGMCYGYLRVLIDRNLIYSSFRKEIPETHLAYH